MLANDLCTLEPGSSGGAPRVVFAPAVFGRSTRHVLAVLLTALGVSVGAAHAQGVRDAAPGGSAGLEVIDGGWGSGEPREIGQLIRAVTGIFPQAVGQSPPPVRIRHRFGGPQVNYDRERDGWVAVYLSARDSRWYQYVYQFAHEYCHLMSRFERKEHRDGISRDHQWFEEALCETASLYALRRLAVSWCNAPGDALRAEAAVQFSRYAKQLLAEPHRLLDTHTTLAAWYARHRDTLRARPYERELNELAATELLPLFEQDPDRWMALAFLHPAVPVPGQTFADVLSAWAQASPAAVRPLALAIQARFGLALVAAPGASIEAVSALPLPRLGTAPECGS